MNTLDYIVIVIFCLIVLIAGLAFGKQGKDMKSFFAAGGNVPWQINGIALFMSFFSAGTFVVWGSIAYQYGLVAVAIQWTMCIGGFLIGMFIAPRWKNARILTAGEFIGQRLGKKVQQYYTYLILFLSLGYTGAFLYPVAKILNVSSGISINFSIIALGLGVILYTAVGGLWAVVITDVLQFVILMAAVIIVVPLAFEKAGGVTAFVENAPANFFDIVNAEYSGWFLFAFAVYNMIFIGGNWAYVQRYTTVKTTKDARKVGYLFSFLYVISPIVWMLPPMIYRVVGQDLAGLENEGAYLLMCKMVLPVGMLGLMLGGMIFATASSVNTTLNLVAAVFTNDIYKNIRPDASQKQLMKIARMTTVVFGLATIVVALLVPAAGGIVEVVLTIGAVTGCSIYGPPIWALFSKVHTGRSIWACTVISLSINLLFKFITPIWPGISLNRPEEMLLGALLPFTLLGVYELYARQTSRSKEQYFAYQATQQQKTEDDEVGESAEQNRYGIRVMAITLSIIGVLIIGLGIISKTAVVLVTVVGCGILVVAAWLFKIGMVRTSRRVLESSSKV
ncbi:MAG TPA: sodium:solute symporter family protein [Chryseosolibacter sp.]|nr:sodium:solute symporter family protein [Chryseosolibacter sp.]